MNRDTSEFLDTVNPFEVTWPLCEQPGLKGQAPFLVKGVGSGVSYPLCLSPLLSLYMRSKELSYEYSADDRLVSKRPYSTHLNHFAAGQLHLGRSWGSYKLLLWV